MEFCEQQQYILNINAINIKQKSHLPGKLQPKITWPMMMYEIPRHAKIKAGYVVVIQLKPVQAKSVVRLLTHMTIPWKRKTVLQKLGEAAEKYQA